MKARLENEKIKIYGKLPSKYASETLNIAGGFHLLPTAIHEQEGFYDIIIPEYNAQTQQLGQIYYDETNKIFTYPVQDIAFDLEVLKEQHRETVYRTIQEISGIVSAVKNIYDPMRTNPENFPAGFEELVGQIVPLRQQGYAEIDALETVQEALDYVVRGPMVEGYINMLKSFF